MGYDQDVRVQGREPDSEVVEGTHIQGVVAAVAVRVHDAVGSNFSLNYWHKSPASGVVHDLGIGLPLALEDAEDRSLARSR
jgi:hypothetical protein